ncbi:hypothetical protein MJK71_13100 [Escherichia coli]|nr:hypothetical protein MJK71_13100 [Escherichia coli]
MLRILKGFWYASAGVRSVSKCSGAGTRCGVCRSRQPLFSESDVISLHCPLTDRELSSVESRSRLRTDEKWRDGDRRTSRGALIDSQAAIEALKNQKIGSLGMDVYENERDLFFEDKSNDVIQDDVFHRLSACHNVLFTGHQAFPDSRSSDQYFSDYAAKLTASLEKRARNLPERTGLMPCPFVLPCIRGLHIQIIPNDLSSCYSVKIVLVLLVM